MLTGELMLAVVVGLVKIDRLLGHQDLVDVRLVLVLEVLRTRSSPPRPCRVQSATACLVGRRVDVEQRIADLDVLAFLHVDRDDRPGDVGRDDRLVGADIGVVGRNVAAA